MQTAIQGQTPETVQTFEPTRRDFRVDPYGGRQRIASSDGVEVVLDDNGAVMKRTLRCGAPLSMALPNRVFQGVAARSVEHEDGTTSVTLHLHHADPDLCVPLMTCDSVENAAADWHSWARRTGLPMLMVGAAGAVTVVREAGLQSRAPKQRRARITQLARRPRFLRRRKQGIVGPVMRLDASEIIARN